MRWLALFLLFFASPASTQEESTRACGVDNLTACRSCSGLEAALKNQPLDAGEYFHGLLRNGLFTAFFLDCMPLGERLLQRGADPSIGGIFGSMALSLSDEWPHKNKAINERWAALLLRYHIRANTKSHLEDELTLDVVRKGEFTPSYPDIWNRLLEASK